MAFAKGVQANVGRLSTLDGVGSVINRSVEDSNTPNVMAVPHGLLEAVQSPGTQAALADAGWGDAASRFRTDTIDLVAERCIEIVPFGDDHAPVDAQLLETARAEALDRLQQHAQQMGANAIINVRFATSAISQGAAELMAYGTAVRCE